MAAFNYVEWSEQTLKRLGTLSVRTRVAFAASCAEQLVPSYVAFSDAERWGDVGGVRGALDMAWEFARGSSLRSERIHDVGHQLERVAPALEDFRPLLPAIAVRAVDATNEALSICADSHPRHALIAADDCREAVAFYLFQLRNPSEDEMHADPLMRQELDRQRALLDDLKKSPLERSTIDNLRRSVGEQWACDFADKVLQLTEAKYPRGDRMSSNARG